MPAAGRQLQKQKPALRGMAGWVRLRGTLQVRPCKLGRRIHAAHAPATGPTPPSTVSCELLEPAAVGGCRPLVGTGSDPGSVLDSCEFLRWGFPPRPQETIWRRRVTLDRTVGAMDGAIEHHGGDFACPGQGDPPPPLRYQEGA
ncbi:hypothetical protein C1929_17590 [Stenotrophomonas sp. ZAC14D1_NAIMI4_6]|nr:hypothetical protein C1929_17590 [Stenotrophomonas sp. ZAC14D1_NAIMI4_6]AWH42582.1 hypothetical protein C1927_17590 [Stenotrophomonas sp. ZAC14D1_NAIMI4_1]